MKINLNGTPEIIRERIQLGSVGDFEIHFRRPTYADLLNDTGTDFFERRLRAVVVGWSGLVDASTDSEIPFTWDTLCKLFERFPALFRHCLGQANTLYRGEEEAKNVKAASGLFSADAVKAQLLARSGYTLDGSGALLAPPDSAPKPS